MAYDARIFRILVASPSDVEQEREIIARAIQEWNDLNSFERKVVLLPLLWETHSSPELGDRPQAIINRQLVDSCDMLVGVFWTRLGSPTGKAASGTIEEIERVGTAGKLVMLYFSKIKIEIDSVDLAQYQRLKDFKYKTYPKGLVESYSSLLEFRDKFSKQLAMKIRELISRDAENREEGTGLGPTTDTPEIGLALVHVATDQLFKPGSSPRVESVVCSDIEEMTELLEGRREDADSEYLSAKLDYLKELVNYYCLESSLGSFRLAVENEGETGVRDLILEIRVDKFADKFVLYSDDDRPERPRAPVQRLSSVGMAVGEINISGDHNIVYNVHGIAANDVFIEENEDSWSLRFEIPVVQPERTVVSNVQFWIGAMAPCTVALNATVFSSQATPFKIQSDFDFSVSEKQVTYSEVLELLGEDLSEFNDAG